MKKTRVSPRADRAHVAYRNDAGGIVLNPAGELLLVLQRNGVWSFPKGKVEEGEDRVVGATREIIEETGIQDLQYVRILGSYTRYSIDDTGAEDTSQLKRITLFLFTTSEVETFPADARIREARWVKREEVSGLLSAPKDQEFFEKIATKL